jgi:hypothetical protein
VVEALLTRSGAKELVKTVPVSGKRSASVTEELPFLSVDTIGVDTPDVEGTSRKTVPVSGKRSASVIEGLANLSVCTNSVDTPDVEGAGGPVPLRNKQVKEERADKLLRTSESFVDIFFFGK